MLTQLAWYNAYHFDLDNNINKYSPSFVFYLIDGNVEIWENEKSTEFIKDFIYKKNVSDIKYFESAIDTYNNIVVKLHESWSKKYLESIGEFEKFLDLMNEGVRYFVYNYYSCSDERNPKHVKEAAMKIREADSFYCDSDTLIRATIHKLYPYISRDDAFSVLRDEISSPPSVEELRVRNEMSIFTPDLSYKKISLDNFLRLNANYQFIFDEIDYDSQAIKGQVAYPGKVRGKVRILKNKTKMYEFQDGEILVSPMTTPGFVPAMKRAGAIITDEGGITCHAAIVSRELKVPCVIGTKIATKVLKDGDMVEVDAGNGIIKILKRG